MATQLTDTDSGVTGGKAGARYFGIPTALAENDTIGVTIAADINLHTVPAGGQTLREALKALAVLCLADGHNAYAAGADDFDQVLRVTGVVGTNSVVASPVYVVA